MNRSPLHNAFWQALSGSQRHLSQGGDRARRFAAGYSPIAGVADPQSSDLEDLLPHCAINERIYCDAWSGPVPAGWALDLDSEMVRMVWAGGNAPSDEPLGATRIGPALAEQALALATLTRPGPFGPRTLELGEYYGHVEGGRLLAMAGERLQVGSWREVSGICTHPDAQGRGLARRLTALLLRRQLDRGQTPFLHVMCSNTVAREFYQRLGFREDAVTPIRIFHRTGD